MLRRSIWKGIFLDMIKAVSIRVTVNPLRSLDSIILSLTGPMLEVYATILAVSYL